MPLPLFTSVSLVCQVNCYCSYFQTVRQYRFLQIVIQPLQLVIMEICKVPTLRLKALNKHHIIHIMYVKMEMLPAIKMYIIYIRKKKKLTHNNHNVDKRSSMQKMHAHTHPPTHSLTHCVQTDQGDGQCCLAEIF